MPNFQFLTIPRALRNLCHGGLGSFACFMAALVVLTSQSFAQTDADAEAASTLKALSLDQLMNIEVTSVTKEPEPYSQAAAAIQVITNDEIRRSGASSIPEALRLADSLTVAQRNSHDWAITARGFNTDLANKLLVLVDGRTVYTPLFSGVFWDVQDYLLEDIDRIEVISGPGGTLWGANAVNDVINITTRSAKDTQGFYMETGGGTQLQDFVGVRYGGMLAPNVYFRVYGKYFDRGEEVLSYGKDANDSWNQGRAGFRIDALPSKENTFTLQGDIYNGGEDIEDGSRTHVGGGNVLARWSHVFSDDSSTSLQVYYDRTHLSEPKGPFFFGPIPLTAGGLLQDDLSTYDIDFQHHFSLGDRNHIVWGLGYRYTQDVLHNAPSVAFLPPVLNQNLFSAFVQDEIVITKGVNLTLGTKIEHNDYTGLEVEPSARLQWNFAHNQMLWGAISRAVRTPSRIDRDLVEPPPPAPLVVLEGNRNFDSETLIAYELGYRAQITPQVVTSVSVFYNVYRDLRSTTITPNTIVPFYFENNLEGETYGVEFTANYQVNDWWRLHAGYTLIEEDLRVKQGMTDLSKGHNETADPTNQFSLRSSMNLPHNVELDLGLRWVDKFFSNNGQDLGSINGYAEVDARLAWHATDRLEFSIVGQNLLQNQHVEYGFPNASREEIQRSVYGKVTWRF